MMRPSRNARTTRPRRSSPLEYRTVADTTEPEAFRTVVLVHGIGMSHRYFSRLHDALASDTSVFSIDMPGFGGLPKPATTADIREMSLGLTEMIAALGVGPVTLVGHSMGAQWVVEAAIQRPDLVGHVVVIGPVVDDGHRTLTAQTRALALDTMREPPLVNAIVFTDYLRCGMPWYLRQVGHMLTYPLEERVRALPVALTIIRGGRDPIAGLEWCRRLCASAPEAVLVNVPGHAHVVQHSAPKAVASAIRAFGGAHASEPPL